ncbi:hypothetical protein E5L41_00295 [Helicobacter pylori]|nr:hypothetical protein E5L41_00295 [Helicobacter pylori]
MNFSFDCGFGCCNLDLQNRRFKSAIEDLKRQNRKLEEENIALKERVDGLKEQLSNSLLSVASKLFKRAISRSRSVFFFGYFFSSLQQLIVRIF